MDGHRHFDPVNDASLDREIESLLAAEPSPEFVARVRTRVAQEPGPGRWRGSWVLAMAGAVAAVIVAVVAWPSRDVPSSSREFVQGPLVAIDRTPPSVSPGPEPRRTRATVRAAAARTVAEHRIEIDLPEVVIAENEARTFASLVARIRQSPFDAAVPAATNPDTPLDIKELPPVEPLEIEPIVRVAALHAEGERP